MLLTDIVMPEMDGIELARRASELDPDIKIMFITGFAAVALNSDSDAPKNAKVLAKPVHLRELVSEVNKMLRPDPAPVWVEKHPEITPERPCGALWSRYTDPTQYDLGHLCLNEARTG